MTALGVGGVGWGNRQQVMGGEKRGERGERVIRRGEVAGGEGVKEIGGGWLALFATGRSNKEV